MPTRSAHLAPTAGTARLKRQAVSEAAHSAGLLQGQTSRIQARITETLLSAAKARSGITSDTELLEYALARVAIEDDYGSKLLALEGSVPPDIDLEL